jgi:autotransporter-associated beta strand protein
MNDVTRTSPLRARVLAAVTMMMTLAVLCAPTRATAGTFQWIKNGNGNWDGPINWTCTTDCGVGFPNRPGDTAMFGSVSGNLVSVSLPDAAITVSRIQFALNTPFRFTAPFAGSRLIFTNPSGGGLISSSGLATQIFSVPITLQGPLRILGPNRHAFFFSRGIDGVGDISIGTSSPDKTPNNQAVVNFALDAGATSTYVGKTVVESGAALILGADATSGLHSIPGTLEIGTGTTAAQTATVVVNQVDQIDHGATVVVDTDGILFFEVNTALGGLIDNGVVVVENGKTLSMSNLTMQNGRLHTREGGPIQVTGNLEASGHCLIDGDNGVETRLELMSAERRIRVLAPGDDLSLFNIKVVTTGSLNKDGGGLLSYDGAATNTIAGLTDVQQGTLRSTRTTVTIPGDLLIRSGGAVELTGANTIASTASVTLMPQALLTTTTDQAVQRVTIAAAGTLNVNAGTLITPLMLLAGGHVSLRTGALRLTGELDATSDGGFSAVIDASDAAGHILIDAGNALPMVIDNHEQAIDLRIDAPIQGVAGRGLVKRGSGVLQLTGTNTYNGVTVVDAGTLLVTGSQPASVVSVVGGVLGGTGTVGAVSALQFFVPGIAAGRSGTSAAPATVTSIISPGLTPGVSPGRLTTGRLDLTPAVGLAMELGGLTPGVNYDQLDVRGTVSLNNAALVLGPSFTPPINAQFTLINNDGIDPVDGIFADLPEGATITAGGSKFVISYRGGDGNDVVVTRLAPPEPATPTYYLSEGATGGFFDEDVLIANPNDTAAPVTLTFSKEDGTQVVATRTVPAQARLTVHVDQIPGLESTAVSAQVTSDSKVPLVVERSMFWDPSYYAGHTGTAVDQPAADWFFAEGSQGFFNTFVLVINPNTTPTDVTFTFFRENEPTVIKTVTVGATTRLTLFAGDVPDLVNRSFGIAVHATQAIMAERSMYFGTRPDGQLSGGTESAGVTAPSTHWFMAEGATGGFFDTFILLSNPQTTAANVTVQYLLDTGDTITVPKTIPANTRLTINIEAEDDVRLKNAAVSTVVTSDVAIIAERSMYWPGVVLPWGEGHNSFGVVDAGTAWGLGEGRIGGPHNFHTYILLANPQTTSAEVTVSYLRESGAPVTKTYTVAPTSRFNIDTSSVTDLHDESFGAVIHVTNGVPIIVERSMYWDANGVSFSGGTNATGIPLPASPGAGQ